MDLGSCRLLCLLGNLYNTQAYKHVFFKVTRNFVYEIVHPKHRANEDERIYRTVQIQKLSFDFTYYTASSIAVLYFFRDKHWFPNQLGGQGTADGLFKDFPNWPKDTDHFALEVYYMTQLGVYLFKIAESFAIRRKTYRKFYEFLLHHFIAFTLIIFGLLSNLLPVGVVILFLHDCCDATADVARVWVQTKFRNKIADAVLWLIAVINWAYMRLYVFPLYPIWSMYHYLPKESDPWYGLYYAQWYLIILCYVLIVMHIYWWLHIVWGGIGTLIGR